MVADSENNKSNQKDKVDRKGEQSHHRADDTGFCGKVCQSKWCLVLIFVGMAIGIATSIPIVLLSPAVRERFPPKLKWWQKTIVYQIYPRSFQDSDGDGVGDLPGITSRLDHFNYLNVKALWVSPFYPSPTKDFGYDVSNFKDVDPLFGTLQDFDDFLQKSHKNGLRVILDFVAGHTSSEHKWFKLSANGTKPYQDYYIWSDGRVLSNGTKLPPNNWMSAFGNSAWTWSQERQQFYYHGFLPEQPTLNYSNPLVVEEMKSVLKFWLDRGVDGFSVDAISLIMVYEDLTQDQARSDTAGLEWWEPDYYINNLTRNRPEIGGIVRGWREVLDSYNEEDDDDKHKFLIVEIYEGPQEKNKYFNYGADMPFNFDLLSAVGIQVNNPRNACDAMCIRDVIQNEYDKLPSGRWTNFVLSNHDNHRAVNRTGAEYVDALNVLLLTLRGTPTTYYGEEIGMQDIFVSFNDTRDPAGQVYGPINYWKFSRDPERSPMQWDGSRNSGFSNASSTWLPLHPDYTIVNVEKERNSTNVTTIQVYRDLAALRQEPSLQYGLLTFANVTSGVLSYLRSAEDKPAYLVVIHLGKSPETHDFSRSPVNRGQGSVKVVTSQAANEDRFTKGKALTLSSVTLHPGDGLVIELGTETH